MHFKNSEKILIPNGKYKFKATQHHDGLLYNKSRTLKPNTVLLVALLVLVHIMKLVIIRVDNFDTFQIPVTYG